MIVSRWCPPARGRGDEGLAACGARRRTLMAAQGLGQQQGKRTEAYDLLAPIYDWFPEGFATADLQEAKALLEELAE